MNRKILVSLCLILTLFVGTAKATGVFPFADVPSDHWARETVEYVYVKGWMNGESDTDFCPDESLSRAMFVTILGRMAGIEQDTYPGSSFSDVQTGQWYSSYVAWAVQAGITDGTGNGKFSPADAVTREEMAAMIARYVNNADLSLTETDHSVAFFTDQEDISSWAIEGVELMRQTGILTGYEDGSFQPQETANRAEAATIFMRLDRFNTESVQEDPKETAVDEYETVAKDVTRIEQQFTNADGFVAKASVTLLLEQVESYAEQLKKEGIITDFESNDSCVHMKIGGWLGFIYVPPVEGMMSGGNHPVDIITMEPFPGEMYITYSLAGMKGPDEAAQTLAKTFSTEVRYQQNYDGEEISIETLKKLPKNSIIFWSGHGAYVDRLGSVLFLGTKKWDQATILLYAQEFGDDALLVNKNGQFYISPVFFDKYMPENAFEGSMVYLGTCESFADRRLAESIWNQGAEVILGNTREVRQIYNFQMIYSFAKGLTQQTNTGRYYTISQALAYAKAEHGATDVLGCNSEVKALYREDVSLNELFPLQAPESELKDLLGVYTGSYIATQGETGLTLTIYRENGNYRALFDFYNLPDHTNAKEGSYTMEVSQTDEGQFRFDADEWIQHPSGYFLLNLQGVLQGKTLSGDSPTPFTVTKVSDVVPDMGWRSAYRNYIMQDMEKTANGGDSSSLMREARYLLFDANEDNIPELLIDYGFSYASDRLCTYTDGKVQALTSVISEISYIPGNGQIRVFGGQMGYFDEVIYEMEDDGFRVATDGDLQIVDDSGVPLLESEYRYFLDGKAVKKEDYEAHFHASFDGGQAIALDYQAQGQTYESILEQLNV